MRCKQPDFIMKIAVQRYDNYSTVLFIIQCNTVTYTALFAIVIFRVHYWRLSFQYRTVNFTIFFLHIVRVYIYNIISIALDFEKYER